MSLNYYRFGNVILRNKNNPNLMIECTHRAYEDILQGCKRIADEYRSANSSKVWFEVEINGSPLLDSYGHKIST